MTPRPATVWDRILERLRRELTAEDFRRWFAATTYASDSGDVVTVWVPTEPVRRHLITHFHDHLSRILATLDRSDTEIRFVVAGGGEEDDDEDWEE